MEAKSDFIYGVSDAIAVKVPVKICPDSSITRSGLQTLTQDVNGTTLSVTVAEGDRVLLANQSDSIQNGIWLASADIWSRAPDFNGDRDFMNGIRVLQENGLEWVLSCDDSAVIGTSELTFSLTNNTLSFKALLSETNGAYLVGNAAFYIEDVLAADVTNIPSGAIVIARTRNSLVAGGGIFYFTTATTLTADNGLVFTPTTGTGRLVRQGFDGTKFHGVIRSEWFGAVGDGTTDDSTAINAALASFTGVHVDLGPYSYYHASTIAIPANATLSGVSNSGTAGGGSILLSALSLATAVTIYGGSASESACIKSIEITKESGTIPSGTYGLIISSADHVLIRDVMIDRFEHSHEVSGQLDIVFDHCNFFACTGYYAILSGSYEVTYISCRFGRNGDGDFAMSGYLFIEGAGDTYNFIRCQFNNSGNTVNHLCLFNEYTSVNGIINFSDCYGEGFDNGFVNSNSTAIPRLSIHDSTLVANASTNYLISVGSGSLTNLVISDCPLLFGAVTLDAAIYYRCEGNHFNGNVVVNNGNGIFNGNVVDGTATFEGSAMTYTMITNNTFPSGGLSITATSGYTAANNL